MEIEKLKDYCSCVEATDEDLAEMVNLISLATGWMREPCETFLTGHRREIIDLPSCSDCPIEFDPYYRPFDVSSFQFSLIKVDGLSETQTEITDFQYHVSDGLFHIDAGLPSCKCGCESKCDPCEVTYHLMVEYDAGYDEIPDCLTGVFCNVLEVIHAKNKCDCNDCACESNDSENNITYATGDVVTVALETDIGKVLVEQYKKQLGMISIVKVPSPLWGFAV